MIVAELPFEETMRVEDLQSYQVMDSAPETEFDELVELASQVCNVPISLISLLDHDRQWFKAKRGLSMDETTKDISFCSHAILQNSILEINDASLDERFYDNPLVTGDTKFRFYAGAPIVTPEGHKLGTICVIDTKPGALTEAQQRALTILSGQVTRLLDLRKKNLLLRLRAEEMIAIKTKVINNVLQQKEEDNKMIAGKLHEDLAQVLATGLLHLRISQQNEPVLTPNAQKANQLLSEVLSGLRQLSYDISPVAVEWMQAEELVQDFLTRMGSSFPFAISLDVMGSKSNCTGDRAVKLIRIIEAWLHLLEQKPVTNVHIRIEVHQYFMLLIEDNAPLADFETMRKEVFESSVFDMAQALSGNIDLSVSPEGSNLFTMIFNCAG